MRPIKIYPKDICITFELYSQEIERIAAYIEKTMPFASKLVVGDGSEEIMGTIDEFSAIAKNLLDNPLIKGE